MASTRVCIDVDIRVDTGDLDDTKSRSDSVMEPASVGEYLFHRLHQLSVRTVHGVAGDHNHQALECAQQSGLKWVEHYSALGAGYAADGYARIKGISALMTTFGSGELCALNAVAAAHAECVPIVHVVGMPPTKMQSSGGLLHPSFGHDNHGTFTDLYRPVSCVCTILDHPTEIAGQIDHALRECWTQSRPVYLGLPTDMVHRLVDGERLKVPIDLSLPANDAHKERYVTEVILRYLNVATSPVILVDAGVIRHHAQAELHDLVAKSDVATFVSPMAKGAIDETLPNYCGVYAGSASEEAVRQRVESADLVLSIGCLKPDFVGPSGLMYVTSGLPTIHLLNNKVCVRYSEYGGLSLKGLLRRIVDELGPLTLTAGPNPVANLLFPPRDASLQTHQDAITHSWFWRTFARWLVSQDVVIADPGVPAFGLWDARYLCRVTSIVPTLWSSNGYGVPACQGAALATSELLSSSSTASSSKLGSRLPRTILLTTPGALQAAAVELSVLLTLGLRPIIFILRAVATRPRPSFILTPAEDTAAASSKSTNDHDTAPNVALRPKDIYFSAYSSKSPPSAQRSENNEGPQWRYPDFISALSTGKSICKFHGPIRTRKHLSSLLGSKNFNGGNEMHMVDIEFGVEGDAPAGLGRARKAYVSESRYTRRPGDA